MKGKYGKPERLDKKAGDVLTTDLLPGFELPLAELFSEDLI
jgi:hypothetical protein